jgi:2-polyprenyl-6-methoxyphenol hydroxylase-like FAD-dependent oxidoreductase
MRSPSVKERNTMSDFFGRRAVVIGAGIGGLSAAGALAPYFQQVDVLERDRLTGSAASRPGTPQDRHPHGLLAGGLQALGDIFPGFAQDLAGAGAVPVRMTQDVRWERPDVGMLPRRNLAVTILCASRPHIEFVLRGRVEALANVVIRPGCRATGIVADADAIVRGVRFDAASGRPETLEADFVIDASGRGALTLALLDGLGWERPEATEIGVDIRYATAVVRLPAQAQQGSKLVMTLPNPPALDAHGVLLPMEGGRWMALVGGRGATGRPETWADFLDALRRLITPTLYDILRHAEPPDDLRHFLFPASVWRHFERLARLPRRILPIADAVCRFNPMYGQGMSVAAMEARLLQDVLGRAKRAADPFAAAQSEFMARITSVLQHAWAVATSADLAFPETRGDRPETFEEDQRFDAMLFRAAVADPVVHCALVEAMQLLQPASRLREPDMLRRIKAAAAIAAE